MGGHAWQGGMRDRRDGHCCGRYAPYWNAFLCLLVLWWRLVWNHVQVTGIDFVTVGVNRPLTVSPPRSSVSSDTARSCSILACGNWGENINSKTECLYFSCNCRTWPQPSAIVCHPKLWRCQCKCKAPWNEVNPSSPTYPDKICTKTFSKICHKRPLSVQWQVSTGGRVSTYEDFK